MAREIDRLLDYDDFAAMPDDGRRHEILAGIAHVTPAPSPAHQWASKKLERQLADYFEVRGLGRVFNAPLDVIFTRHDVAEPDLVVVADDRQMSRRGIEGVPALLVEILSPSTRAYDRVTKAERYAALGVRHFWLLDPDQRRLQCHRLEAGAWRLVAEAAGADTVEHPDWPGLTIRLGDLWPDW